MSEVRLIDANALSKAIKDYAKDQYEENEYLGECAVLSIIDNAPTVAVNLAEMAELNIDLTKEEAEKLIEQAKTDVIVDFTKGEFCSCCDLRQTSYENGFSVGYEVGKTEARPRSKWQKKGFNNQYLCGSCRTLNPVMTKFCPNCGSEMGDSEDE